MKAVVTPLATLTLISLLAASPVMAGPTDCPEHFANGQAPEVINQKLGSKTREVCYSGYAIKHSGVTRTPLYAAEHLTRERLVQGKGLKRHNSFHPDENIPAMERAELRHYSRSGYDRGHIAPSADMFDSQSRYECFSLANMVPQIPENNRGPWEAIESNVRKMARERGNLYVVSGPIFQGEHLQQIGGAVMVPTKLFKAVYDPDTHEAGAYVIENAADALPQEISITELEKNTGISIFPSLSTRIKSRLMKLTDVAPHRERKHKGERNG
ncbi:MAG: DNA/RNA non-specific endonuclease [Desulfuromonadales bacterium]|nr:DNA/RNA non-specific endonuclease [Desulfuromonadales bacterium]